jgi:hypothetical protein
MRAGAVLEQENPLPSAEREASFGERDRQLRAGQQRADMGGHVVRPLQGMDIALAARLAAIFRHQPLEGFRDIVQHFRARILGHGERRRGMSAPQRQQPGFQPLGIHPRPDGAGEFGQALAAGLDRQAMARLPHRQTGAGLRSSNPR